MRRAILRVSLASLLTGCQYGGIVDGGPLLPPPQHLRYEVEPSGTPGEPAGVLLRWDLDRHPDLESWNVYSRPGTGGPFVLRGGTTSPSFHDDGQPQLQYYVTAVDAGGVESPPSGTVTVDERLALASPRSLTSVSLNAAIALVWSDNSYTSDPEGFRHYRIYSASYDLDGDKCGAAWHLEGTTVAPEFRVGALANGIPQCFAVSAISIEGFESLWSPTRFDTPRPDARNVALTVRQVNEATSGFRFWRDQNSDGKVQAGELGRVGPGGAADVDFVLERDGASRLWLTPVRTGTTAAIYGNRPVGDLTDIDVAPSAGYSRSAIETLPGWGYVFQMDGGDRFPRYGAVRVSHVGRDLLIFDWSYQTDPGNPELVVAGR